MADKRSTARKRSGSEGTSDRALEPVRIRLLGGFEVSVGSRTIRKGEWPLRKAANLLKLLALAPGHRLHRERIMDALWPDSGRRAASNSLRRTLHSARRVLDPDAGSRYLASEDEQLVLCPDASLWVDVEAFEEAAAAARRSRVSAAYRAALDLYAGDLLPSDRYEGWAEEKRGESRRLHLELLVELAEAYEERSDLARAVEALRMAVAKEPVLEEAHAGLMRLYALSGREGEALAQYERLRATLSKGLARKPSTATKRLRDEIASGKFPSTLASLTGAPREERPLQSSGHNLPAPRTSFVGRERELLEVKRELAMTRLLNLTGTGGSGKTRLALEVARSLVGAYPDGVWLVELAAISKGALVPHATARALGVKERPEEPLTETLAGVLRNRQALLVLDNCEHLVEAVARLTDLLLDACPRLRVLATSREPLGIPGEAQRLVSSLSVPDRRRRPTAEELGGYESVRLFAERARYRDSSFALTPQNAQAVARICERLEGIPLALELAAARVGLSEEQIASRLDDSLGLLTTGSRIAPPRQRSLRGALDWSYDLLSEPEQKLFGRLSVFAGGWTLEAAEAVGSGEGIEESEILDLLSGLVDKSLVVAEATGNAGVRYRMLEPVRQYSRMRLEERGEVEGIRHAHAGYFLALAEEAALELQGSEQGVWLERLETEHDNVRAALSWSLGGHDPGLGLRLAAAFCMFWYGRGYLSEGSAWLQEALTRGTNAAESSARAKALHGLGIILEEQGTFEQAETCQEEAFTLFEQLESRAGVAESLFSLGRLALLQGDAGRATILFERCLAAARESANKVIMPKAINGLAVLAVGAGEPERARRFWEEALALEREQGNYFGMAMLLADMAFSETALGNYERSAALSEEALALGRKLDLKGIRAFSLFCLGLNTTLQGEPARANSMLRESLSIDMEMETTANIAEDLEALATTAAALGQHARAARLWGAAKAQREVTGAVWRLSERMVYEPARDATRSRLEEAAWETGFAEGKSMNLEQAVEYALSQEDPVTPASPEAGEPLANESPHSLTRREREVAELVARGLTNRRIAEELFVSERTVDHHVSNILKKFKLSSREQLASRLGDQQPRLP